MSYDEQMSLAKDMMTMALEKIHRRLWSGDWDDIDFYYAEYYKYKTELRLLRYEKRRNSR